MAVAPSFTGTPRVGGVSVTAAQTSWTAPTASVVMTAGASGTRIDNVDLVGTGVTPATMIRLFLYDGTAYYLWLEIPTVANTPGANVPVWSVALSSAVQADRFPLILPSGWSLRATANDAIAAGMMIIARGGDF